VEGAGDMARLAPFDGGADEADVGQRDRHQVAALQRDVRVAAEAGEGEVPDHQLGVLEAAVADAAAKLQVDALRAAPFDECGDQVAHAPSMRAQSCDVTNLNG
jgi:hypothetical protein